MTDLPPIGGHAPPVACSRLRDWPDESSRCPNEATHHVIWDEECNNGLVCVEHSMEAVVRWKPYAIHAYRMECSMPGAMFHHDENVCIIDEDGLGLSHLTAGNQPSVNRARVCTKQRRHPMAENLYPPEVLGEDEDDGTMPANVAALADAVVGHRIVSTERARVPHEWRSRGAEATVLTLDNGQQVALADTDDCCAYTQLEYFLLHPERVDHIITGVGTTDGFTTWHIYADLGDVMELKVGWSCGNPFYYGYGFDIRVIDEPAGSIG